MPTHQVNQFKPRKHCELYQKACACVNRLVGGDLNVLTVYYYFSFVYTMRHRHLAKGKEMGNGIIFFATQWFTIQPDLFGRIEDEVGELGESEKEFIRICTTARWAGTGVPCQPQLVRDRRAGKGTAHL